MIRWAALLYARGYDVLAADQRDFFFESQAGYGYPNWLQTFGWKESQDVLAAGTYLAAQPGTAAIGVVGIQRGRAEHGARTRAGQRKRVFQAGLTFSGPADQNTQISDESDRRTDALVALVDRRSETSKACGALADAAAYYNTSVFSILAHETAMHAQTAVRVPLLNVYTADDSLVPAFEAKLMAAYESGNPLQRTVELQRGEHAYFFDRWWQQRSILLYFKATIGSATTSDDRGDGTDREPDTGRHGCLVADGSTSGAPTRAWADAQLAPDVCDPSQGVPGNP